MTEDQRLTTKTMLDSAPKTIEHSWLVWLVKVRFIIITFLLGIELSVATLTRSSLPKPLFVVIIVLGYAVAAVHGLLQPLLREDGLEAKLQISTDLCFVTAILYVTGGPDSPFNFLYPLIIIIASILLSRRLTFLTSLIAFLMFGAVVELGAFGIIHSYATVPLDARSLTAIVLINLFAYVVVALLATTLSSKFRQVRVQLQDKSGALENLQALHENIVYSINGGLITTDLDYRVTLINPAAERFLDRPAAQIIGQRIDSLFDFGDCGPEATPSRFELPCVTPSGTTKIVGLTVSRLSVSGSVVGHIYSFTDLTEIRRLERQVRLSDRMAAVGRLSSAIAHEIRNPLSSLAGSAQMLHDVTGLDEEQRTLLDIIRRESERLNRIVSDFLAYSREKEYRFEPRDLVSLLEDTVRLLENRPELSGPDARIRVVRQYQSDFAPANVDGDRIKQVFWNVCDNAVRAMAKSGGKLTITFKPSGERWAIVFSDSGPGVDQKKFDHMFEPYQSTFARGKGLGLAIVYQIVQAHEGIINVQSSPGCGTEVIIELKRAVVAQNSTAAYAGRAIHG